jgi:UDP-GlcNAc:undecaprenyl-phosphate GlcNAc-1-phosphate transferase
MPDMMIELVFASGAAFVLGYLLNILFMGWSARHGILVNKNIPCVGGLAFGIAFLVPAYLFMLKRGAGDIFWGQLFLLALAVLCFGVLDDLRNLSIRTRFGFQILVAAILISMGVKTQIIVLNGFQNIILTTIWLLWIFNAFNLLDVLDGLAAGSALIASLCFFVVTRQGGSAGAFLPVILGASLVSFLIFNFPPAKMYMGNSGSYFLGFVFGVVSLLISYTMPGQIVALATPVIILGFLIFDTIFLVATRLWRRKKPFHKSDDHLCLRCLALGFSKRKILLLLWGLCLFYAASGVLINRADNRWGLGILVIVFIISAGIARKAFLVKVID